MYIHIWYNKYEMYFLIYISNQTEYNYTLYTVRNSLLNSLAAIVEIYWYG